MVSSPVAVTDRSRPAARRYHYPLNTSHMNGLLTTNY